MYDRQAAMILELDGIHRSAGEYRTSSVNTVIARRYETLQRRRLTSLVSCLSDDHDVNVRYSDYAAQRRSFIPNGARVHARN